MLLWMDNLKSELVYYMAAVDGAASTADVVQWWKRHAWTIAPSGLPSTHSSTHLTIHPSIHPSKYPSIHIYPCPPTNTQQPHTYHPFIHSFIHQSINLPLHPFIQVSCASTLASVACEQIFFCSWVSFPHNKRDCFGRLYSILSDDTQRNYRR